MKIKLQGINKHFGQQQILDNISLEIPSGEMVALLGPSGSGKTTLLRIIAGLENLNSGMISFDGTDVSLLHARDRHIGFVFQHYALFRHMTVFDNVAFGLMVQPKKQRLSNTVITNKVTQLLKMVQLSHLAHRYPAQLSGGQKQRVALVRALAIDPKILLLDEPFAALDTQVRKELRRWLSQLHTEFKFTSVFVTHDQEEAMEVANRIIVMREGRIEQQSNIQEMWQKPANHFVLEFMGKINAISGQVKGGNLYVGDHIWPLHFSQVHQDDVKLYIRPWDIMVSLSANELCQLPVIVNEVLSYGHYWKLAVHPLHGNEIIDIILTGEGVIPPTKGTLCFIGGTNGYLYAEGQVLQAINLAMTA